VTFERSHGKVRPSLVRASDLRVPETGEKPTEQRDAHGHFSAGNRSALGARFTHTIRKALGSKAATGEAQIVARDARRVYTHVLGALPSDAPPVRVLVTLHARHLALNAFFTAKAEAVGLDTPEGLRLLEVADRQSQRAERVLVTAQDIARVCAKSAEDAASPEWLARLVEPKT
jgi:hypothetical protein